MNIKVHFEKICDDEVVLKIYEGDQSIGDPNRYLFQEGDDMIITEMDDPSGTLIQTVRRPVKTQPSTLDESVEWLREHLPGDLIEKLKNGTETPFEGHMGIGKWMRNNWGLWTGSDLRDWFVDRGIDHADDMSGIILTSFRRTLNNEPIKLEEQIQYYKYYYKKMSDEKDVK